MWRASSVIAVSLLACAGGKVSGAPVAAKVVTPTPSALPVQAPSPARCGDLRFPLVRYKADNPTRGQLTRGEPGAPPEVPPPELFERVQNPSSVGPLYAYVTPDPSDGQRHPVVVWAHGGFDWSIGDFFFEPGPRENDQSAAAFREAGLMLMLPSFRNGNDNPGAYEELFGEVDDFLCAAAYAASLPYVDPERVYLAGHSTGGTLVLLAAASTDRFREAIAFGPVSDPRAYGEEYYPFSNPEDAKLEAEWQARSPIRWLRDIARPTLIVEGQQGNADSALELEAEAKRVGAPVTVKVIKGASHFSILRPVSEALAPVLLRSSAGR